MPSRPWSVAETCYPDRLLQRPGPARWDVHHQAFYDILRRARGPVLDLTDEFIAARGGGGTNGPVYCRHDTHWSPRACAIAADRIAAEIRKLPCFGAIPGTGYRREAETREITGDLWTMLGRTDLPKESVTVRTVSRRKGDAWAPPEEDEASPVVLLADSHGLVFHVEDESGLVSRPGPLWVGLWCESREEHWQNQ